MTPRLPAADASDRLIMPLFIFDIIIASCRADAAAATDFAIFSALPPPHFASLLATPAFISSRLPESLITPLMRDAATLLMRRRH
jgi:hypothetical protein